MAMSKKDYEAVAKVIRDERGNWESGQVGLALSYVASALASTFAASNPRFDRAKFLDAARVHADLRGGN